MLLLGVIQNVINQIGSLDSSYQSVVSGAFLLVVVVAQTYLSRTSGSNGDDEPSRAGTAKGVRWASASRTSPSGRASRMATVSNVVNGYRPVGEATRLRVQQAIDELGYTPNLSARHLRRGRTGIIALAIPELNNPYFAELAEVGDPGGRRARATPCCSTTPMATGTRSSPVSRGIPGRRSSTG